MHVQQHGRSAGRQRDTGQHARCLPRAAPSGPLPSPAPGTPRGHASAARHDLQGADPGRLGRDGGCLPGQVRYVLHNGSQDPGTAARLKAGPAVTGAERRRLLAAFNGGFKLSAGAGGYEQEGHVLSGLRDGLASLVIDRSGRARLGVWGATVPAPGEPVYSVRQNLQPLVLNGRPSPAAADWQLWGSTLGGGEYVARSALGQDKYGDLLYAGSMSAAPAGLADALISKGARIAMELDINPEWVQMDVAARPGGPLSTVVPGQNRPAGQFLTGWTRDFITALAPPRS